MLKKFWVILLAIMIIVIGVQAEEQKAVVTFTDDGLLQEVDGVSFFSNTITIFKPGIYELAGNLTNGQICVSVVGKEEVQIIFNGINIHNDKGAAINVKNGEARTIIVLMEGTENIISDGPDLGADPDEEPNAAIFSKGDLEIKGTGSLLVKGQRVDGIASKDNLIIHDGRIVIDALRHGIKGKDSVWIKNGEMIICAGKDGIKSTNKQNSSRGFVRITGGTISITAGDDPIQVETTCSIENAKITWQVKE